MNSEQKVQKIAAVCEDRKAIDLIILDVRKVTLIADYFVICHGTSRVHVDAIVEHLSQSLKAWDERNFKVEGSKTGGWMLVDCGDIMVNVFLAEEREYYGLERLWGDAEQLEAL